MSAVGPVKADARGYADKGTLTKVQADLLADPVLRHVKSSGRVALNGLDVERDVKVVVRVDGLLQHQLDKGRQQYAVYLYANVFVIQHGSRFLVGCISPYGTMTPYGLTGLMKALMRDGGYFLGQRLSRAALPIVISSAENVTVMVIGTSLLASSVSE